MSLQPLTRGFRKSPYISFSMTIESVTGKRILLSPLNWGMGHVSRCIGLIHRLKNRNNCVFIACSEEQQNIFEQYFTDLTYCQHEGYPFEFKGKGKFGFDLARKSSSLYRRLKKEKIQVEALVDAHSIDLILSDHRYGFCSKKVKSIFVTHQVNLPVRFHEKMVSLVHNQYLSKFDHIWVMDYPDSRLAGTLSASNRSNLSYIGPFSRFSSYSNNLVKKFENVLIASGPDVYAQQLIDEVCTNSKFTNGLIVIHNENLNVPIDVESISANWLQQDDIILKAKHIISRSGYSTIMDCLELDVRTTLIPTKGQREQEYLARINK